MRRLVWSAVFLVILGLNLPAGRLEAGLRRDSTGAPSDLVEQRPQIRGASAIIDDTGRTDVNNLDMVVTNHGSFAYDLLTGNAGLIYPKGTAKTVVFAAGPWIGAKVNGTVRVAVGEYSQEYTPGPMANGTFQPDLVRFKNYKIVRGNTTSADYLNWPVQDGAPVDPTGKPALLGDAMIWSVYNDANPDLHSNRGGFTVPLGVEIQQTTFAFSRSGALGNMIFLKFRILNKGGNQLDSTYFSAWCDPDLGGFTDDLVGCDTTLSLGYCYNATNADQTYGASPPAVGFMLLQGPRVRVAPSVYDRLGMVSFNKYSNGTDPKSSTQTYNQMQGLNPDGSPVHVDDDPSQPITRFQVSGDPVIGRGWLDSNPADRRFLVTSGPFAMAPGDVQDVLVALIVGQGSDRLSSISDLRSKAAVARIIAEGLSPLTAAVDLDPNVINLSSHAPWVTAYIEPSGFDPTSIDISTLRLAGSVPAASKLAIVGDHDSNGVPDLMVKFSRAALDPRLTLGLNELEVTGSLVTGGEFQGRDAVRVINPGGAPSTASVAPNPLNPSGVLRFRTTTPGQVAVNMFDLGGRLMRTLVKASFLPAGVHEVRIDGQGERGQTLASGVYFYRVETAEGVMTGRIVILK